MPNAQDVFWFKSQFQPAIEKAIAGTPFSVDMIAAFACQETGEIWPALRRQGLPTSRILELCVGDTIDASPTGGGRRAFPKNRAELTQAAQGDRMFEIARQGLVDMATYIPAYRGAASRPDKFCHGFGIFQLDLQFFKSDPDYFLSRRYADFDAALARCVGELKSALRRVGWQAKTSLSDTEMAGVAIAYNTGRYDPAKGLKQGYFDGTRYYGENYHAYLQLAKGVRLPAAEATPSRDARALPEVAKIARKAARKAAERAKKSAEAAKQTARTAKTVRSGKKAGKPAKKAVQPAKQVVKRTKKAVRPAKKVVTRTKQVATPAKKVAMPAKKVAMPAKKVAMPAKKAINAAKKAASPRKRAVAPARKAASKSAKKTRGPTVTAIAKRAPATKPASRRA